MPIVSPVDDAKQPPAGVLDRWVSMVKRTGKAAIDALNKRIRSDEQVENVLLPVRDGIMLVRKL